jgi:hypothetical protein
LGLYLLTFDGQQYCFVYTHGVKQAEAEPNFQLLHSFPERDRIYKSSELFPPLFSSQDYQTIKDSSALLAYS